MRENTTVIIK